MAKLTNEQFYDKWVPLLADNVFQDINGARFEQLLADLRDTFASADSQALTPVAPAVNFDPVLRQLTATHVLGTSALEYNHHNGGFTAYAPLQVDDLGHAQGEWRFRVKADTGRTPSQATDSPQIAVKGTGSPAGPGKIKSTDISDSTEAGRALLTAQDVAAQRKLLDNFVILAGQYGVGQPRFEQADGPDGVFAYMLRALAGRSASAGRPAAPTLGQVDDKGDTFSFQPTGEHPSFAQYKVAGLPQTTGAEWLNTANSYVQNGRVYVRVVGEVPAGGLAVYVGASGNVPDGQVLTNADRFTASSVSTTPGALQVDFSVDNASLSPGDTLGFTAKASGGTAPYTHSVQALNVDTGAVTVLGTASTAGYTGTWAKVAAGVYLVTDAVSDAAGASLVSVARRVVVAAPGTGGGVPLVPATRTRLGGVRVGDGLEVATDGVLSTEVQLQKANTWAEVGDYSAKGLKLPIGGFIDEVGHLFIRQVDVGQRHFMFGRFYSLAKDSLIQWKPDEYVSQDGNGDVGLARVGPGVLEVNTGTIGDKASLSVLDLIVSSALNVALNTFSKVVAWIENAAARLGTTSATDPAAPQSALAVAGLGLRKIGNVLGLLTNASQLPLGPSVVGLIADDTGQLMANSFAATYLASGFLEVQAGSPIFFKGNATPQFCAYYDGTKAYLRAVNVYQDPYLGTVPPGAVYVRLSYPKADYPTQWYSLGRLPYVRGLQTKNGSIYPDGQGIVDIANYLGTGTGYTDTQARAAQLGRTAPAGTSTVTLTAEAPTDYGTIASGSFTIDATDCVVGKCVRFAVAAGGQAPSFTNAPAGQPYKYLGASYASGKPFSYSLLVGVDRIEVVTLAD